MSETMMGYRSQKIAQQVSLRTVTRPAIGFPGYPDYRYFCLSVRCAVPGCGWVREFWLWTARQWLWAQQVLDRGALERRYLRHLGRAH